MSKSEAEKMTELRAKVEEYQAKIAILEDEMAAADSNDVFGRIEIVECKNRIRDYSDMIKRLERRIAGIPEYTDEQLRAMEYMDNALREMDRGGDFAPGWDKH